MITLKCETCQVTYKHQPSKEYATNFHNFTSDHPASWEKPKS